MTRRYTDDDLYDMFANQADPRDLLDLDVAMIRQQVSELIDEEHNDTDANPLTELDDIVDAILRVASERQEAT